MLNKFKKWLTTPDEEGLTGYDALCMMIFHIIGFSCLIIGGLSLR